MVDLQTYVFADGSNAKIVVLSYELHEAGMKHARLYHGQHLVL